MEPTCEFLYAKPSFIEGLARIFDFGNTLTEYNTSPSGEIADEIALRMDWIMVGDYIGSSSKEYAKEKEESTSICK